MRLGRNNKSLSKHGPVDRPNTNIWLPLGAAETGPEKLAESGRIWEKRSIRHRHLRHFSLLKIIFTHSAYFFFPFFPRSTREKHVCYYFQAISHEHIHLLVVVVGRQSEPRVEPKGAQDPSYTCTPCPTTWGFNNQSELYWPPHSPLAKCGSRCERGFSISKPMYAFSFLFHFAWSSLPF